SHVNHLIPLSLHPATSITFLFLFFFNHPAPPEIYTLSLHDALPIWPRPAYASKCPRRPSEHIRPPSFTIVWPISPAAPRPTRRVPSSTSPPPTPVPQNTPRRFR